MANQQIRPAITINIRHRKSSYVASTIDTHVIWCFLKPPIVIEIDLNAFLFSEANCKVKVTITIDISGGNGTNH